MGTWISHLRIAETLFDHLSGLDQSAFTFGSVAPDSGIPNADWTAFDPPKEVSHFLPAGSTENNVRDLIFYRQYLQPCDRNQNPSLYSYLLGYFVHLISDRLWSEKIGKTSQESFPEVFSTHTEVEAWEILKEDWYSLDQLYVRDHPGSVFWRIFLTDPLPQSPLPFIRQEAFEHQMQYIRTFYSHPPQEWILDRPYPYLNEATMQRYVDETSGCVIKILRLLSAFPPPEGIESATLLLTSAETGAFLPPLGDLLSQ
jgi:Zinc dependent phospholipase C